MILYQHQVLTINQGSDPVILLGHDQKNEHKKWVFKLNHKDKGVVDDYFESALGYVKKTISKPNGNSIPSNKAIFFGKYKKDSLIEEFNGTTIPDTEEAMEEYLRELKTKLK